MGIHFSTKGFRETINTSDKFYFFNPKIEKWQKLSSKPKSVFVKNTNDNHLTSNGLTKREIEVLGKDIKYIYNENPFLNIPIQPLTTIYF